MKWKTKLKTRLRLYESLVKSILLYNCVIWGLSRDDHRKLSGFDRKLLELVIGIKSPHKITNKKLYKTTETEPLSITITERRWKLLGHILRLPVDCPAKNAMRYYPEERANKKFVGRRKTVIVTTINKDIRRTKELEEKKKSIQIS